MRSGLRAGGVRKKLAKKAAMCIKARFSGSFSVLKASLAAMTLQDATQYLSKLLEGKGKLVDAVSNVLITSNPNSSCKDAKASRKHGENGGNDDEAAPDRQAKGPPVLSLVPTACDGTCFYFIHTVT